MAQAITQATHYSPYPGNVVVLVRVEGTTASVVGIAAGKDASRARMNLRNLGPQRCGDLESLRDALRGEGR